MKKDNNTSDELRRKYQRSDFGKLERGRYFERVRRGSNIVVLDPELAPLFPDSAAVNKALRSLAEIAENASGVGRRRHHRRRTSRSPRRVRKL